MIGVGCPLKDTEIFLKIVGIKRTTCMKVYSQSLPPAPEIGALLRNGAFPSGNCTWLNYIDACHPQASRIWIETCLEHCKIEQNVATICTPASQNGDAKKKVDTCKISEIHHA